MHRVSKLSKKLRTKLKKGDNVIVTKGDDRGKKGKILRVIGVIKGKDKKCIRVVIAGVAFAKKHTKPQGQGQPGGIIQKEAPIDISNVMFICPRCNKPTKLGMKFLKDNSKSRVCKECGEVAE